MSHSFHNKLLNFQRVYWGLSQSTINQCGLPPWIEACSQPSVVFQWTRIRVWKTGWLRSWPWGGLTWFNYGWSKPTGCFPWTEDIQVTIWLFNSLPWKDPPFLRTVNHLFRLGPSKSHGELLVTRLGISSDHSRSETREICNRFLFVSRKNQILTMY